MRKNIPIKDIAIDLADDELFFSITNNRGFIQLANDIFAKVSGYSIEELKGAPHNIIRHPDMPKTIFKLMWDTIKGGYPFGGYIKNLNSDGRSYWVYALVLPLENRYLSIRLKPREQSIQAIERLYQRLINIEQTSAIAAETELNHWILARDFLNYHTWASSCLSAEIDTNIRISSRAFPDNLERLSFRSSTRTDLVARHTLNQIFKGYKFLHRNIIDWLKCVDQAVELFYDFQAELMVLNRELAKKTRSIHGPGGQNLNIIKCDSSLLNPLLGNLRFFFESVKKMQFHRSSVLLHLSSMNAFVLHFFDSFKSESTADIPLCIDSVESLKLLTQSLLLCPQIIHEDQHHISQQISNHFENVDSIIKFCEKAQVPVDNVKELIIESKEKGNVLLKHYSSFHPQALSHANSFYQMLVGGELILEGVARYKI